MTTITFNWYAIVGSAYAIFAVLCIVGTLVTADHGEIGPVLFLGCVAAVSAATAYLLLTVTL